MLLLELLPCDLELLDPLDDDDDLDDFDDTADAKAAKPVFVKSDLLDELDLLLLCEPDDVAIAASPVLPESDLLLWCDLEDELPELPEELDTECKPDLLESECLDDFEESLLLRLAAIPASPINGFTASLPDD